LNLELTYLTTQHLNKVRIVSTAVDYVIDLQMFDNDNNVDDDDGGGGDDGGDSCATLFHTVTLLTFAKLARL